MTMSVKLYSNVEVAETGDAPTTHDILGATQTITGGAALDLVGQSAPNTITRVTPSSNPGANAKVLASTSGGLLTLEDLTVNNDIRAGGGIAVGDTTTNPDRGVIRVSDATVTSSVRVAKPSGWGYNVAYYRILLLGQNDAAIKETISLGCDISGNSGSGFQGDGREIIFRRGATFITPNAANTDFCYSHLFLADGMVGIGTNQYPSADGRTHLNTFGVVGGSMIWEYNGLDGTARTIIQGGSQDVVSYALFNIVIKPSTGAATSVVNTALTPGTSVAIYNSSGNTVTLYCNAGGDVTVARTGGTLTYKLIVQILWL
jgi:hypothetical protein